MIAEERWLQISRLVDQFNIVSVAALSKQLGTSDATIRRDLQELEKKGLIRRTHGGAVKADYVSTSFEPKIVDLANVNIEQKMQVAYEAYQNINSNDAIIIDSSSTSTMICKFIKESDKTGITVATNSARAVMELAECSNVEIILIGGQVRKNIVSCIGPFAELMLSNIRVDKAFIGVNGIDIEGNIISTPNLFESEIKRAMMRSARESIIVTDSAKFNKTFLSKVCQVTDVDYIITDSKVSQEIIQSAKDINVDLVISSKDDTDILTRI